jgi:hypothetical protein
LRDRVYGERYGLPPPVRRQIHHPAKNLPPKEVWEVLLVLDYVGKANLTAESTEGEGGVKNLLGDQVERESKETPEEEFFGGP